MNDADPLRVSASQHFAFLDLVRFGAALLVAFGHVRGLFFSSIQTANEPGGLTLAFYLVTGVQHEAVVLFFVVSGFLVGGGVLRAIGAGRFSPRRYAVNRFSRIYIVLIPGIAVAAAASALGHSLFPGTRFYTERPLLPSGVGSDWGWEQVPCHLAAVQGLFCKAFSFDPPLWSLGYEWTLYIVGPLLFAILYLKASILVRAVILIVFVSVLLSITPTMHAWFDWPIYWLIGAAAAWVHERWPISLPFGFVGLIVCAAAFPVSRLGILPLQATDLWISLALAVAFTSPGLIGFAIAPRLVKRWADFSFSLYVLHLPLAVFIGGALESAGWPGRLSGPSLQAYSAFAITMAVVLVASSAFAHVTERQTAELRAFIYRLWDGHAALALERQSRRLARSSGQETAQAFSPGSVQEATSKNASL
jgi:peptidoglycan/LPS O-acetylase OafA/YrhL